MNMKIENLSGSIIDPKSAILGAVLPVGDFSQPLAFGRKLS